MVTKGIVQKILDNYNIRVRLPILDGIENSKYGVLNKDLSVATISCLPNTSNLVSEGDIVFVAFEDNDLSKPVIIGHLYKESLSNTKLNLELNSLITNSITKLNEQTWIGEVRPHEISYLHGLKAPIQQQIDNIMNYLNMTNEDLNNGGNSNV